MLPPKNMINKDFLKKILKDEKKLLPLADVKYVNVPRYDELSVKRFWPILRQDEKFMMYIPDKDYKSTSPAADYFWNVANTVQHEYVQNVIKYANDQRMKTQ